MKLELSYPDILEKAKEERIPLFIPVGTIEYHSLHIPLGCDGLVAYGFLEKLAEKKDIIIAPPVWYGPASYAVRGPEGYSIDMDGKVFNDTMYNIYMSLLKSGWRNIYTVIAHQTETFNPTETACLDASRRVLFKYLEENRGIGWWGSEKSREFYNTLDNNDNPWNWIKVYPLTLRSKDYPGDHAGVYETSYLWDLYPGTIRPNQIGKSTDWFTETAKDASKELGEKYIKNLLEDWCKIIDNDSE